MTLLKQRSSQNRTVLPATLSSPRAAVVFLLTGIALPSLESALPTVNAQRDGTNVAIHFSGRLQSASRVEGPYTNILGARSPHFAPLSESSQRFWRSVLSDIRTIATSGRHMLAIRNDGTLWAWGDNQFGQLGIGTFSTEAPLGAYEPVQIGTDTDWQTVTAGSRYSFAIKSNGTLWAWGDSSSGQLGVEPVSPIDPRITSPTQVGPDTNWRSVATGGPEHFIFPVRQCFTLAIRNDGTLWGWGENGHAQLGNGTTESCDRPIQIGTDTNWETVVAGHSHAAAIRTDGTLWAWGNNASGQVGIGTVTTNSPFGADHPVQVGTNGDWQTLTASESHTLAIRSDHTLWAWGSYLQLASAPPGGTNRPTQLDIGSDWQAAATADKWTMALRTDGTLWGWGYNFGGQLGAETSVHVGPTSGGFRAETNHPVQVGTNATWLAVAVGGPMSHFGSGHTVALQKDGTVWTWGGDGLELGNGTGAIVNEPVRVGSNTDWKSVFAGALCSFGLRTDGTLWAWGENERGQLGIGRIVDVNYPAQVGTNTNWYAVDAGVYYAMALREDGTLWSQGQPFGSGLPSADAVGPFQVSPGWTWRAVAAGEDQYGSGLTAAIRSDGTLWTWAPATIAPVQLGIDSNWRTVAAGWYHGVAIKDDGTLWAWGRDGPGGLGTGIPNFTTNQPVQVGVDVNWKAVAADYYHTLALRTDGTLWTWGDNSWGELGNGSARYAHTNQLTQVGTNSDWKTIAAGFFHSLAIRADGTLWSWGGNMYGQLGLGLPTGYEGGSWTNCPAQVGTNTTWSAIAAGLYHSMAVRTDGTLWAWGDRSFGQTAQPVPWLPHPVTGTNWMVSED